MKFIPEPAPRTLSDLLGFISLSLLLIDLHERPNRDEQQEDHAGGLHTHPRLLATMPCANSWMVTATTMAIQPYTIGTYGLSPGISRFPAGLMFLTT